MDKVYEGNSQSVGLKILPMVITLNVKRFRSYKQIGRMVAKLQHGT